MSPQLSPPGSPGFGIVRRRQSSLPVCASCAVITQASGPPSGSQLRPEITLPFATIGPDCCLRAVLVVEDIRFPRELAGLRVERVDVVVRAVVDE